MGSHEFQVIDDSQTINDPQPLLRHQLGDHLESSSIELDEQGDIISYEEYYPYGSTSYQAVDSETEVSAKRYRFTGKERDEESGLYYHGARYYAPWLSRWTAADPAGMVDGPNLYQYVRSNPVRLVDPDGRESSTSLNPIEKPIGRGYEMVRRAADTAVQNVKDRITDRLDESRENVVSSFETLKRNPILSQVWERGKDIFRTFLDGVTMALEVGSSNSSRARDQRERGNNLVSITAEFIFGSVVDLALITLGTALSITQTALFLEGSGRELTTEERQWGREAGISINYSAVRVKEGFNLILGLLSLFGARGAFVFGNTVYVFPGTEFSSALVVHELVHVWQYQNYGPHYMRRALGAQIGGAITDFAIDRGGIELKGVSRLGLGYSTVEVAEANVPWEDLNPEQQAEVVMEYFIYKSRPPAARPARWDYLEKQAKNVRHPSRR